MLNKINTKHASESGFTIVELLIATAVFSVIMLIASLGIIRIGQAYYKGLIENRTQEATRLISEDVSRTIQLAGGEKRGSGNVICIGDTRFTYNINQRVTGAGTAGLLSERIDASTPCVGAPGSQAKELLGKNMRLLRFRVAPADADNRTYRVDIKVAYGEDGLLTPYDPDTEAPIVGDAAAFANEVDNATCRNGAEGSSFCATSQLDTLVKRRLNTL